MSSFLELRKAANLTQAKLAELLHVDQTAISQWERGVAFPRSDKIPMIAKLFNCTIDQLFEHDQKDEVKTVI